MFACFKKPCEPPMTLKQLQYERLNKNQKRMYNHNFSNTEKQNFHKYINKYWLSEQEAYKKVLEWRKLRNNNGKKNGGVRLTTNMH